MYSVVLWTSQSWLSFKGEGGAKYFSCSLKFIELKGFRLLYAYEGVEHCHLSSHFNNEFLGIKRILLCKKVGSNLSFFFHLVFILFYIHSGFLRKQRLCRGIHANFPHSRERSRYQKVSTVLIKSYSQEKHIFPKFANSCFAGVDNYRNFWESHSLLDRRHPTPPWNNDFSNWERVMWQVSVIY